MPAGDQKAEAIPMEQAPAVISPVPVDEAELFAFLQRGDCRRFARADAQPHPSAGPHTRAGRPVRVFYSDAVAASPMAGRNSHPKGSAT